MCARSLIRAGVSGPISSKPIPAWRPSARAAAGISMWATRPNSTSAVPSGSSTAISVSSPTGSSASVRM
jgi:hypothetical protein